MHRCVLMSAVVVLVAAAAFAPHCQAFSLESLLPVITDQLGGLWQNGEMELLGHYCNYQVKPTFKKFELFFIGSVWCPGWTPIRGEGVTTSRSGVLGKTTRDFVRRAHEAGLISKEEASEWLN